MKMRITVLDTGYDCEICRIWLNGNIIRIMKTYVTFGDEKYNTQIHKKEFDVRYIRKIIPKLTQLRNINRFLLHEKYEI